MLVYNYMQDFVFVNASEARESPLEPGVYLIPANATTTPVPTIPVGQRAVWTGENWVLQAIPAVPPSTSQVPANSPEHTPAEYRAIAYRQEADPLFFQWQRGESTQEAWLAKVAEIKLRYPN